MPTGWTHEQTMNVHTSTHRPKKGSENGRCDMLIHQPGMNPAAYFNWPKKTEIKIQRNGTITR